MSEKDLDRAVERLIGAANEEGGVDNISCRAGASRGDVTRAVLALALVLELAACR